MALYSDASMDLALGDTNDGTRLDICHTTEPTTYATAISQSCGNYTSLTIGAPVAGDTSGRKVVVSAIVGGDPGSVTDTQTASWWAITNGTDTLYAVGDITTPLAVTNGNDFTLTTFDIEIQDPTSV